MSSRLKDVWVRYPLEKRRYFLIVFFIFITIGIVQVATYLFTLNLNNRWEDTSERRTREILRDVLDAFARVQDETYTFARHVTENPVLMEFMEKENPHDSRIFLLIEELNRGQEYSIELYDLHLSLLAWGGKQAEVDSPDVERALTNGPLSVVSQSALYTFLTVLTPIQPTNGKAIGVVAVSRPVEVNYPLNNRFLTSSGLQKELSKRFGTSVRFEFGEDAESSRDGRIASAGLLGLDGKKLGMVHIERPMRNSYIQDYQHVSDEVTSSLVAIIPIIIALGFWSTLRRLPPPPQGLLFLGLVCGTRYLWIAFNFPSILFRDGIFDPSYFASPFGFGLTKSIGEMLISSLFLFASAAFMLAMLVRHTPARDLSRPRLGTLFTIAGTLVFGAVLSLLIRGYAEAIRSAVFDSTLKYTDPTTIVPPSVVGAMLFGLLLLTISILFAGATLFLLALRSSTSLLASTRLQKFPSWIFVVIVFAGESILFGELHPNPQTSQLYRLIFVGLIALFSFLIQHEVESFGRLLTGKSLALAMVSASSSPHLFLMQRSMSATGRPCGCTQVN